MKKNNLYLSFDFLNPYFVRVLLQSTIQFKHQKFFIATAFFIKSAILKVKNEINEQLYVQEHPELLNRMKYFGISSHVHPQKALLHAKHEYLEHAIYFLNIHENSLIGVFKIQMKNFTVVFGKVNDCFYTQIFYKMSDTQIYLFDGVHKSFLKSVLKSFSEFRMFSAFFYRRNFEIITKIQAKNKLINLNLFIYKKIVFVPIENKVILEKYNKKYIAIYGHEEEFL